MPRDPPRERAKCAAAYPEFGDRLAHDRLAAEFGSIFSAWERGCDGPGWPINKKKNFPPPEKKIFGGGLVVFLADYQFAKALNNKSSNRKAPVVCPSVGAPAMPGHSLPAIDLHVILCTDTAELPRQDKAR